MIVIVLVTHLSFFFFNDTATTEIYTLSLHDALPISPKWALLGNAKDSIKRSTRTARRSNWRRRRSEEHTSELQSHLNLVCRLLLEKKKKVCDKNVELTANTLCQKSSHLQVDNLLITP